MVGTASNSLSREPMTRKQGASHALTEPAEFVAVMRRERLTQPLDGMGASASLRLARATLVD